MSEEDSELEQLLMRLLRAMAPGSGAAAANSGSAGSSAATADSSGAVRPTGTLPRSDPDEPSDALPELSASEARALIELVSARGIAQGELAGLLGLEKSTVSRLAAGLERKGWIRRGRDEGNQRYLRLYFTPQGAELAARLWQAWQSRHARILAALSNDERAGLSAGLRGLVRGLAAEGMLVHGPTGEGPAELSEAADRAVGQAAGS